MDKQDILKPVFAILQIIMTTIAGYAATEIRQMSNSINNLNVQIAVLLTERTNQKEEINDLKDRVKKLELKK